MDINSIANPLSRRGFLALAAAAAALTACGAPTTSGGGGAAGVAGTPLKAATYIPPSYADLFPAFDIFFEAVKKASGGEITFDMFDSGKLLAADQLVPGLTRGVADIVFQTSSYVSTTYPITGAYELPFVNDGTEQTRRALEIGGPLYELINQEIGKKGLHLLGSMPTSPEYIWTIDKPIRKPEDLKGMRIRTAGNVEGETVKALGGSPVSMSSAEVYEALQRGTIDGIISYQGTVISRDLQNVLRYGTVGQFGLYSVDAYVRKDWFDDLESAKQEALLVGARAYLKDGTDHEIKVHKEEYVPKMLAAGLELIEPTAAELQAFEDASANVYKWWRGRVGDEAAADKALELVKNA